MKNFMFYNNFRIFTIILIILIDINISYSQDYIDTIEIAEIEIFSQRDVKELCLNIQQIDTIFLKTSTNSSLSELLSNHTGLFVKNYGKNSLSTISFRGTAASHTQILWNEISVNSPMSGQVDLSQIPIFLIDDIEIQYGSSSLSKTIGALGGSISLENKPKWNEKFSIKSNFEFGSFETFNTFSQILIGNQKIQSKTRFFLEKSKNNFKFKNTAIPSEVFQYQDNADYCKQGIFQEIYYRISKKSTISFFIWHQVADRNIPQIMTFTGYDRIENQKDNDLKLYFSYQKINEKINFKFNSSFIENKLNYFLGDSIFVYDSPNIFIEKNNSFSNSKSLYNNVKLDFKTKKSLKIQTKLDINYHQINSEELTNNKNNLNINERKEIYCNLGIYKQFKNQISVYFLFNSLFTEKYSIPIIPAIGVYFKPFYEENLEFKINISKNHRLPSLNDLYWLPGGNSELLPEKSKSADFSVSYSDKIFKQNFSLNFTIFSSLINDWIVWQPSEFQYWTAKNLQKVFSYGNEICTKIDGNIYIFDYRLILNYSFTSTKNIENEKLFSIENQQLIYIPKNIFNLFSIVEYRKYSFIINYSFTDKRITSLSSENYNFTLNSYSITNISFSKKIVSKKINFSLKTSVNNVFNKQYQSVLYRAMAGRSFLVSLQFELNK